MSRKLQILMPMAGLGSRFAKAGFELPKPLIPVDGQPMFKKALGSVEDIKADKSYFFVIRQEHANTQNLDNLIKQALPQAHIIIIPEMTRGAAETALVAYSSLDPDSGLIVMDCDLWFKSRSYNQMVADSLNGQTDISGGLLTFEANNPRYSFAQIGNQDLVTKTAEKQAISNHAITGAYFFATASDFRVAAKQLMSQPIGVKMPEYYMSLLYNILINEGRKVQAAYVDEFASFGTPEELSAYESKAV